MKRVPVYLSVDEMEVLVDQLSEYTIKGDFRSKLKERLEAEIERNKEIYNENE